MFVSGTVHKLFNERFPYHGSMRFGALAGALVLGMAVAAGGCSMSMPSLFAEKDSSKSAPAVSSVFESKSTKTAKADSDTTGTLALQESGGGKGAWSPADWSIAKSALREVLGRGEAGSSQPWENPTTGARGTVTPVAAIYEKDGFPCRNFIIGGVREGRESWYEGMACRIHRGQWDVVTTRPLQKS